jgi:hypothetical protein
MVRRANANRPGERDPGPSGWHIVLALVVIASVIMGTLLITKDPGAVTIVTIPLLIVLGWWIGRRLPGGLGE